MEKTGYNLKSNKLEHVPKQEGIMKRFKVAAVIILSGLLLYGCKMGGESSQFPPEQSTIYVSRDGEVYTALVKATWSHCSLFHHLPLKQIPFHACRGQCPCFHCLWHRCLNMIRACPARSPVLKIWSLEGRF